MMKTRKDTRRLLLIRYDKLTRVILEAVLYPRAKEQPEKHSEAGTSVR
jgi:hypothetical protein